MFRLVNKTTHIKFKKYFSIMVPPISQPLVFPNPTELYENIKTNTSKLKNNFFKFYPNPNKINLEEIQYCSDVHVDHRKKIPTIIPTTGTLMLAGDVGLPTHKHVYDFFKMLSENFDTIYYTPGNHDYGCSKTYDHILYSKYYPIVKEIIGNFKNVILLDNDVIEHNDNVVIVGTTLWSAPNVCLDKKSQDHYKQHLECVKFINLAKNIYHNKKIIIMSHYVPTHRLIEEKYHDHPSNSYFVTDLEYLMTNPIHTWICGHTHSVGECDVGDVKCLINAHGYVGENNKDIIKTKTFFI